MREEGREEEGVVLPHVLFEERAVQELDDRFPDHHHQERAQSRREVADVDGNECGAGVRVEGACDLG